MAFPRVASVAVLSAFLLFLVPLRAEAQVVTTTANNGPGSLRDTIAAAAPESVITFDPALTAGGPATITLTTGQLSIAKNLTINGPGAGLLTISGNNASRVFNITAGDFAVSGLTIANAVVTNNPIGGGVSFIGIGSLTITECRIVNNVVTGGTALGGGLFVQTSGPVAITDTTVSGNTATASFNGQGGGIFIESPDSGGANVIISNSTVSGNTANGGSFGLGGGINFSTAGTLVLSNTTVTGNSATASTYAGGGGIYSDGVVTAVNATIAGNTVTGAVGSHFKGFGGIQSAQLALRQTIVAGNTLVSGPPGSAPDLQAVVTSQGFNLIGIADGTTGLVASDLRGTTDAPLDPWLAALADNGGFTQTLALLPGSPGIDAGDPAYSLVTSSTDQRWFGRVYNRRVDIGAFEYGAFGAVTRPASDSSADGAATLNGIAYRNYLDTDVSFRFGTDPTLAVGIDTAPLRIPAGTTAVSVAQDLTGLALDTTYYFKLVLTNAEGRFEGRILSFVLGARISVEEALTPLTDNASTVDFGRVAAMVSSRSRTFTLRNTGELPLTSLAVRIDGADAGDFAVSGFAPRALAPGATTSFIVTFRPGAAGARHATLRVASNTAGEANPFDVALTGTGQTPTIWNGPDITVSGYDRLTPLVYLWRDYDAFYNGNTEGSFNWDDSPTGTLWAFGTTANLSSLTFRTFASILDEYVLVSEFIGQDMVLYLIEENIVLNIRITAWEDWGDTFTYVRSTGVVPDRAAPRINGMPAHIAVEAADSNGATVSWVAPWAYDDVDGNLDVSCAPASSSLFAPGTTTVTCTATDAADNVAEKTFTVTVTIPSGPDADGDGIGDNADTDDDNDGVPDASDAFPLNAAESVDTDGDGIGDNADTDDDNDGLPDSIDPFPTDPNASLSGRMRGNGSIAGGAKRDDFAFDVDEGVRQRGRRDGDTLRLSYEREDSKKKGRTNRFESTAVTSIMFIDDPAFHPNSWLWFFRVRTTPSVDTVIFSGTGRFNGKSGYTFEATATDQGEPGRRRDTFSLVVKDARGVVVFSESGELSRGNIESLRLQPVRNDHGRGGRDR